MLYRTLSEACLAARARRNHTQDDAAAILGKRAATWKAWEQGKSKPQAQQLLALADYIGVKLIDVVRLVQHDAEASDVPTVSQPTPTGVVS